MGWFGDMSGLGHDKPALTLPPNIEAGSPEAVIYETAWNNITPTMYHDQNPHDWVMRYRAIGRPIPPEYKDIELLTAAEVTQILKGEGYSDRRIHNFLYPDDYQGASGTDQLKGLAFILAALIVYGMLKGAMKKVTGL